jgi:molecular chaperone HscB
MQNHFELFGLARTFALDVDALERAYREIQARIHPDRYAHAADADRRAAMQWATRVNEAYRTLRSPVNRGRYLLELSGADAALESNTAMPAEFLMRQMELREALEEAKAGRDAAALERLGLDLGNERRALVAAIGDAFDAHPDNALAAQLVRKLMFLDRLDAELREAFEAIEA